MATYTEKCLVESTQLGTAAGTLYMTPDATTTIMGEVQIANSNATQATVTVYLVASGGTAGPTNVMMPAVPIPPNSVIKYTSKQVLMIGDSIAALASNASGVIIRISGVEKT